MRGHVEGCVFLKNSYKLKPHSSMRQYLGTDLRELGLAEIIRMGLPRGISAFIARKKALIRSQLGKPSPHFESLSGSAESI